MQNTIVVGVGSMRVYQHQPQGKPKGSGGGWLLGKKNE